MIAVNGKQIDYTDGLTVTGLLEQMNYIFPLVIVKVNSSNIPPDTFPKAPIKDGDIVEVIHMMSGG